MHGIEGVVDVQHDAARHTAETRAVVVHHGAAHAQQGTHIRQVLGARDGRLRAQVGMLGKAVHGELEHRVDAQMVGVTAVLEASCDHQHAEADDLLEPVKDALRRARVHDAPGETPGNAQPLLDLAQHQQAAIRGQLCAVKARNDRPAADR